MRWSPRQGFLLVCAAALCCTATYAADQTNPEAPASGKWQDVSAEGYRNHLTTLISLTQQCAKSRNVETCDPLLIGSDDRVPVHDERRLIRYGWLRVLFARAEESDDAAQAPGAAERKISPVPSKLLQDAETRLADDLKQASIEIAPLHTHQKERAILQKVLAEREFRNLKRGDVRDTWSERLSRWLNKLFNGMGKLRAHSAWLGRLLVWGFVALVGIGLTWALIRIERRWRVRLIPESDGPAASAASARDWQLWLADARKAAGQGEWRDAIHLLYWAAISRLESKRLWPADRARTPREYLALVAPDDPRKVGLAKLTGAFERTWYGGRSVDEEEYRQTEALATRLIEGGAPSAGEQA